MRPVKTKESGLEERARLRELQIWYCSYSFNKLRIQDLSFWRTVQVRDVPAHFIDAADVVRLQPLRLPRLSDVGKGIRPDGSDSPSCPLQCRIPQPYGFQCLLLKFRGYDTNESLATWLPVTSFRLKFHALNVGGQSAFCATQEFIAAASVYEFTEKPHRL